MSRLNYKIFDVVNFIAQKCTIILDEMSLFVVLTVTFSGSFQSTTKELPTKNIEKFDLTENTYVSMHIFQCYYCSISVELICANSIVNKEVVSGRDGYRMVRLY
jgi:aerobic-type carbon monoxide dehydrogenase small subunit (CoxS/CutS family)